MLSHLPAPCPCASLPWALSLVGGCVPPRAGRESISTSPTALPADRDRVRALPGPWPRTGVRDSSALHPPPGLVFSSHCPAESAVWSLPRAAAEAVAAGCCASSVTLLSLGRSPVSSAVPVSWQELGGNTDSNTASCPPSVLHLELVLCAGF